VCRLARKEKEALAPRAIKPPPERRGGETLQSLGEPGLLEEKEAAKKRKMEGGKRK